MGVTQFGALHCSPLSSSLKFHPRRMIKRNNLFHYYKIFIVKSKNAFSRLPPYKAYNQKPLNNDLIKECDVLYENEKRKFQRLDRRSRTRKNRRNKKIAVLCGRSANKTARDKCYGAFPSASSRAEDTADTEIVGENSVVKERSEHRRIEKKEEGKK